MAKNYVARANQALQRPAHALGASGKAPSACTAVLYPGVVIPDRLQGKLQGKLHDMRQGKLQGMLRAPQSQ